MSTPFYGSTKRPNPKERPLGVFLRSLERPAVLGTPKPRQPRKADPKVFKAVAAPRRSSFQVRAESQARQYGRSLQIPSAIGKAGLSGRVTNTKAHRLLIQAHTVGISLSMIQDYLAAKGVA
jgi:hypothetical protein